MKGLLSVAVAATMADAAAYALLIVPGTVAEANPLVASMNPAAALWLKAGVVVLLALLVTLSDRRLVKVALLIATAVGTVGAASTVQA